MDGFRPSVRACVGGCGSQFVSQWVGWRQKPFIQGWDCTSQRAFPTSFISISRVLVAAIKLRRPRSARTDELSRHPQVPPSTPSPPSGYTVPEDQGFPGGYAPPPGCGPVTGVRPRPGNTRAGRNVLTTTRGQMSWTSGVGCVLRKRPELFGRAHTYQDVTCLDHVFRRWIGDEGPVGAADGQHQGSGAVA